MSQRQLCLLGVPEVRLNGQPVRLRTRKMLAPLAYLAVEGGAPQGGDEPVEPGSIS